MRHLRLFAARTVVEEGLLSIVGWWYSWEMGEIWELGDSGVLRRESGGLPILKQRFTYHFKTVAPPHKRPFTNNPKASAVEQAQLDPCINYGSLGGWHCEEQSLVEATNLSGDSEGFNLRYRRLSHSRDTIWPIINRWPLQLRIKATISLIKSLAPLVNHVRLTPCERWSAQSRDYDKIVFTKNPHDSHLKQHSRARILSSQQWNAR